MCQIFKDNQFLFPIDEVYNDQLYGPKCLEQRHRERKNIGKERPWHEFRIISVSDVIIDMIENLQAEEKAGKEVEGGIVQVV